LLANMADAIAAYEAEFREFTDEELAAQRRADRRDAIVVRGRKGRVTRPKRKATSA